MNAETVPAALDFDEGNCEEQVKGKQLSKTGRRDGVGEKQGFVRTSEVATLDQRLCKILWNISVRCCC